MPTERAHYEALRRQALAAAEAAVASDKPGQAQLNILAQLTRLRRAACDPRLVSPQLGMVGAKVKAFGELAAELHANGHKTLVFSQFVDFLALLREPLDAAGIAYQYLDGSTPAAERTRRVAAFQAGEGDLFLISLKAGGFGLNLTVGRLRRDRRPVVESGRRRPGQRARSPHRPAATGDRLPDGQSGHAGRKNRRHAPAQARTRRQRARWRRGVSAARCATN